MGRRATYDTSRGLKEKKKKKNEREHSVIERVCFSSYKHRESGHTYAGKRQAVYAGLTYMLYTLVHLWKYIRVQNST